GEEINLQPDSCVKVQEIGIRSLVQTPMTNILELDTIVTVVKTYKVLNDTKMVLLLGDQGGNIRKVYYNKQKTKQYLQYNLGPDPIASDMEIDTEEDVAYILTGNTIVKFPAWSCAVHSECDQCLISDDPIVCGWCEDTCTSQQECRDAGKNWSSGLRASCPPTVRDLMPRCGPTAGGTTVTIHGKNFGEPSATHKVWIGRVVCAKQSHNATRITCETGEAPEELSAPVTVSIHDPSYPPGRPYQVNGQQNSSYPFCFKNIKVRSFFPTRGPQSGGTNITIRGKHLDIGSSISVNVSGIPCNPVSISSSELSCITQKWSAKFSRAARDTSRIKGQGAVLVSIDRATVMAMENGVPLQFSYMADPVIKNILPQRSILSGGIPLTVTGSNLDASVTPQLRGTYGSNNADLGISSPCQVGPEGTQMICPSLNVSGVIKKLDKPPESVRIYFWYDGNKVYRDSVTAGSLFLQYYPDPEFLQLPQMVSEHDVSSGEIVFSGRNLDFGVTIPDIHISIGSKPCTVTSLTSTELKCQPDVSGLKVNEKEKYSVQIQVGHLVFNNSQIGYVEFVQPAQAGSLSPAFTALIIIILLIVAAVIILLIVMKRQRCGFFKVRGEFSSVQYTADQDAEHSLMRPDVQRNHNLDNDYTEGGATYYGSGGYRAHIDEETLNLIESEHLLVDRECLTLADEIGKGNFGCVRRGFLTLPEQKGDILVAVKTLH
ncbi:unnamed protein product, partial [Candidula unifasciata]